MSHLVRPDRPISPQAMAIHRITEEMVADKPWIAGFGINDAQHGSLQSKTISVK
jgi:hypothetical protein